MSFSSSKGGDPPLSKLLTVAEVAAVLAVSPRSVWAMLDAGTLRRIKLGARITRIARADVEALIAGKQPRAAG